MKKTKKKILRKVKEKLLYPPQLKKKKRKNNSTATFKQANKILQLQKSNANINDLSVNNNLSEIEIEKAIKDTKRQLESLEQEQQTDPNIIGETSIENRSNNNNSIHSFITIESSQQNPLPINNTSTNQSIINENRYGGTTEKIAHNNRKWKYKTTIQTNNIIISEQWMVINNHPWWTKIINISNRQYIFVLSSFNNKK